MPKTPVKNDHTHFFALMDQNEAKELDDNVTRAAGVTTFDGAIGDAHMHKWHLWWDSEKSHYIVQFGPGGKIPHDHPPLILKTLS